VKLRNKKVKTQKKNKKAKKYTIAVDERNTSQ